MSAAGAVDGVLLDLLMAVMNSIDAWTAAAAPAASDRGLAWRDAVTARMAARPSYATYESLVADAAAEVGLPPDAPAVLYGRWARMDPWPDAAALRALRLPYAFVTNCSRKLGRLAEARAQLNPRFTLSAEQAGFFKPDARVYLAACERLGTRPQRTLFVAGSPYDAAGASAAGLRAWLVPRRADHRAPDPSIEVVGDLEQVVRRMERNVSIRTGEW